MMNMNLMVHELFYSIEGETVFAGFPAVFVRLCGCNLNCRWCDTPEAKGKGHSLSVASIIDLIAPIKTHHITVTGGEPLCQEGSVTLMDALVAKGYSVQLETNGSISIANVPHGVRKIVDVKTPSSGEEKSFLIDNLDYLDEGDEVKFIIADIEDYEFSRDFIRKKCKKTGVVSNLSIAWGAMTPGKLASMMLRDSLSARLNIQLHKVIWGEQEEKMIIPLALH